MPDKHDKSRNLPDPDIFAFDSSSTTGFILQRGLSSESNPNEEHEDQMTLQEIDAKLWLPEESPVT